MEETIGYEALLSAEEWDSLQLTAPTHTVTIWFPPGEAAGNEARYQLECDICKTFAATDTEDQAGVLARLHEVFFALDVGE